jgi:hypothetical protein
MGVAALQGDRSKVLAIGIVRGGMQAQAGIDHGDVVYREHREVIPPDIRVVIRVIKNILLGGIKWA